MVVLVMQAVCILGISAVLSHPYWRKLGRSNREVCISSFPTSISELGLIDPTFARTGLHVEPKVKGSRMPERRPLAVRRKHLRTMSADDAEHVQETSVMTAAGKKGRDEGAVHQSAMNGELADAPGKQEVEATAQGQLVSSSQEQRVEYRMTDWEMRKLGELRTEMERKLSQQLTPEMRRFCSDPSLVRFLRARNWNVKKSLEFLRESLVFRHKYKPHLIRWDDVKEEGQSGKIYRFVHLLNTSCAHFALLEWTEMMGCVGFFFFFSGSQDVQGQGWTTGNAHATGTREHEQPRGADKFLHIQPRARHLANGEQ